MALYNVKEDTCMTPINGLPVPEELLTLIKNILTKTQNIHEICNLLERRFERYQIGTLPNSHGFQIGVPWMERKFRFILANNPKPLSLKEFALRAVSRQIKKIGQMETLEIPDALKTQLAACIRETLR